MAATTKTVAAFLRSPYQNPIQKEAKNYGRKNKITTSNRSIRKENPRGTTAAETAWAATKRTRPKVQKSPPLQTAWLVLDIQGLCSAYPRQAMMQM